MTTLKNFTRDYISQSDMLNLITIFSSELKDDNQFKKAQRYKDTDFMDVIKANANLYRKYPTNVLPIVGVFEALININDFEGAILFYNKYVELINKKYLFFFDQNIEKLKSLMSRKDQNPYLKFYGNYNGYISTDNKREPAVLEIIVTNGQLFEVSLIINEKYFLPCTLSLNGEINSHSNDDPSIDPDDFDDRDTLNGNGKIDALSNIEFSFKLNSYYESSKEFKFLGNKKIDYFNSVQNDFFLK